MSVYITTPTYYVNDIPHIGHAYCNFIADTLARYYKLKGEDMFFTTGTDEHGQKIENAAIKNNIPTAEYVDKISQHFKNLTQTMQLENTDYIRTTESRHLKTVNKIWNKLYENNYIYKDVYSGWYAVRDECFYQDKDLIDGKAPTGADVEWLEEESYFFRLSQFQDKLLNYYEKNKDFIFPQTRFNEVISFVQSGLKDLSISRNTFTWGIKVPNDPKHVIYVWIDALTNYITSAQYYNNDEQFKNIWEKSKKIHVLGKDILIFHAVFWPAILMACNIKLPEKLLVTGWWTNEGQKISKSLGNVIDPLELLEDFHLDYIRYFLLREITLGQDGNFSRTSLIERINNELVNNIGNLVQRTSSMVFNNCTNAITNYNLDISALSNFYNLKDTVLDIENFQFTKVLEKILKCSSEANLYIEKNAPWSLKKTDHEKMQNVLYNALEMIRCIAITLQIFIPNKAKMILDLLNIAKDVRNLSNISSENSKISYFFEHKPKIIFEKYYKK